MSDKGFVLKRISLIVVLLIAFACIIALFTHTPLDIFTLILMIEGIALLLFGGAMYSMIWGQKRYGSWTRSEQKAINEGLDANEISSQTRKTLRRTGLYFALIGIILVLIGFALSIIF